jgi:hypothetical protein
MYTAALLGLGMQSEPPQSFTTCTLLRCGFKMGTGPAVSADFTMYSAVRCTAAAHDFVMMVLMHSCTSKDDAPG